jgi:hypothetical protein
MAPASVPSARAWLCAGAALVVGLMPLAAGAPNARAQTGAGPAVSQTHAVEGAALTLEIDRREIAIDGRVRVTVRLELRPDRLAGLPELADRFGAFAVVMQTPVETRSSAAAVELTRAFELEPEGVGELVLPPLVVPVRGCEDHAGTAQEIRTDPVAITVISVVPAGADYTEPKDIAPPLALPQTSWPVALGSALGALVLALAVLTWLRMRRRTGAARPQPAHLLALAELDRLRRAELDSAERIDAFYVRLSAILRQYLGWRFGVPALRQTTEECVVALPGAAPALAPYRPVLGALLLSFDRVKFARHRPEPGDIDAALRRVRDFVERTADERALVDPGAARLV